MSKALVPFYAASIDQRTRWRLVTQNLLASAECFERTGNPEPTTIADLSTFIDLYCLYDKLVLMKDPSSEQLLDSTGQIFTLLKKSKTIIQEELSDEVSTHVVNDAESRLSVFLRGEDSKRITGFLGEFINPSNVKQQAQRWPHDPENAEHFSFGKEWLLNAPSYRDLLGQLGDEHTRRSAFFVARTFFYLAFANIRKYTFAPDAARAAIIAPVLTKEKQFIQELIELLKTSYKPHGMYPELESLISPLSVIVYERAARKDTILSEAEALREELRSTRDAIYDLEDGALSKGQNQSQKATKKWQEILGEIDKSLKGVGLMISRDQALDLGEAVTEVTNPKSWFKPLRIPIDVIYRMCNRGPVVQIHKLIPQLGGTDRVQRAVKRLFKPK